MKRLYIDFDGVVMDTIPLLYNELAKNNVQLDNEQEIRKVFAAFDFGTIIKDKNILNDSISCIHKLIDSGIFEVSFLTHVNSLNEGVVKIKYLRRHFKDNITIIIVPKEVEKPKMVYSKGAILVDDFSGNLKEWEKEGGIAIRFSPELESHGFKVINKLDSLLDIFDENGELKC